MAKVAVDVLAKHMTPAKHGVKTAELNGMPCPIADFWWWEGWKGLYAPMNAYYVEEVTACSANQLKLNDQYNDELLYRTFGKNAEILIDYARGLRTINDSGY